MDIVIRLPPELIDIVIGYCYYCFMCKKNKYPTYNHYKGEICMDCDDKYCESEYIGCYPPKPFKTFTDYFKSKGEYIENLKFFKNILII